MKHEVEIYSRFGTYIISSKNASIADINKCIALFQENKDVAIEKRISFLIDEQTNITIKNKLPADRFPPLKNK